MLLCDGCDGEHFLSDTGLAEVPEGDWYCNSCERRRARAKGAREKKGTVEGRDLSTSGKSRGGGSLPVAVEQYDLVTGKTIETFPSQHAAARATGVRQSTISKCIYKDRKHSGEYGWRLAGGGGGGSDGEGEADAANDDDDGTGTMVDSEEEQEEEDGVGQEDALPNCRGSTETDRGASGPSMDALRRLCGDERRVLEAVRACPAPGPGPGRGDVRGVRAVELVMRLVPACDPSWRWYDLLHSELGELTVLVDEVLYGAVQQGRLVVAEGAAGDSDSDSNGDGIDLPRRYVLPIDADIFQASGWDRLL